MTFVFFTDRDLGTRFPEILKRAGLVVERHRDHFLPDCPDEDWLAEVGKRGWVALTHDARIRYKPNELAAVIRHRVRLPGAWSGGIRSRSICAVDRQGAGQ